MKKAQANMELMIIVGFIILLFIPLIVLVYYKSEEINSDIEAMHARTLSSKLAYATNSIGAMGDGTALKMEFYLPRNVQTLEFKSLGSGGEVLINMSDGTQISQVTRFPISSPRVYMGGMNQRIELYSENSQVKVRIAN
ncbi:hypothetical protein KJ780_03150 [Candidatus Micrarchaeota archaeon]|nr:hypothetical protein [Candidatus Micrarchaeota archaeon]